MSDDITAIMATFVAAVNYFNRFQISNWSNLAPLLHTEFKMKRLDDPDPNSYHEGRDTDVQGYFVTKGKDDQAEFKPIDFPDCKINGDHAVVSGFAWFIDITNRVYGGPTPKREIRYRFTFKKSADGNWQVKHSWGEYVS